MKKIFILLFLMIGAMAPTLNILAQEFQLARIEQEQIAYLETKVARDLAQDTFKKRLVFAAALASGAYLGYRYFNPREIDVPSVPASFDQLKLNNAMLQTNNELLRNMLPEMQKAGSSSWLQDSSIGKIGSWMWETTKLYSNQAFIAYIANVFLLGSSSTFTKMIKTVDGVVDSVSFNLFHARDIKWFLISRVRITHLFNELERHAYCIQSGIIAAELDVQNQEQINNAGAVEFEIGAETTNLTLDATSYAYHVAAFKQTWQQLSIKLASVIAFIEHKAHTADQSDIKERLLLGAQHILQLTNATAQQCEILLALARPDALPKDVLFEVRRLRSSVSDELMHANKLEHEVSW